MPQKTNFEILARICCVCYRHCRARYHQVPKVRFHCTARTKARCFFPPTTNTVQFFAKVCSPLQLKHLERSNFSFNYSKVSLSRSQVTPASDSLEHSKGLNSFTRIVRKFMVTLLNFRYSTNFGYLTIRQLTLHLFLFISAFSLFSLMILLLFCFVNPSLV